MLVQKIIQESINGKPLEMKETFAEELRNRVAEALAAKIEEAKQIDEAGAVVTHKWYSVKHWKDGSDHFDNLDDHLRGHSYKHSAIGNTAKNRPDHHIGIPVKAKSAIAYMEKHAKPVNEEVEQIDEISKDIVRSYADKSFRQANTLLKHSLSDQPKSVEKASKAAFKRRQFGIKAAGRRLGSDEMHAIHKNAME